MSLTFGMRDLARELIRFGYPISHVTEGSVPTYSSLREFVDLPWKALIGLCSSDAGMERILTLQTTRCLFVVLHLVSLPVTRSFQSHMAFIEGDVGPDGLFLRDSTCPSSHPVRVPLVFYEIVWDTKIFSDMWPKDGSQPFVLSMGDP